MNIEKGEWGYRFYTLENRIDEIRQALKKKMYQSALALALTIPAICGKIKFSQKGDGERYRSWFNEYVTPSYMSAIILGPPDPDHRIFNGRACYQLRCAFLHSGNDDLINDGLKAIKKPGNDVIIDEDPNAIKKPGNDVTIDEDLKAKEKPKEYKLSYNFALSIGWEGIDCSTNSKEESRDYEVRIDIPKLCENLCLAAEKFMSEVPDKAVFEDHSFPIYSSKQYKRDRQAALESDE